MDFATPALFEAGIVAAIGKGKRSPEVVRSCQETGSVYLMRTAGNAAKAEGVFKGADILVQLVMKRDK